MLEMKQEIRQQARDEMQAQLAQELQKAAEQRSAFDAAQQQKDRTINQWKRDLLDKKRAINQLESRSAMGSGYVDWQYAKPVACGPAWHLIQPHH